MNKVRFSREYIYHLAALVLTIGILGLLLALTGCAPAAPQGREPRVTLDLSSKDNSNDQTLWIQFEYAKVGSSDWEPIAGQTDANGQYIWDTSGIEDGEYRLRIIVTDPKGKEGIDTLSFYIIKDPTGPSVTTAEEELPARSCDPDRFKILDPKPDTEFPGDYTQPITIGGEHRLDPSMHIWIFLNDIYGWYYLQNPPARLFADGTWEATNIRPGSEIRYIVALCATDEGHQVIKRWVAGHRWQGISEEEIKGLPGGAVELDRVRIRTPGSDS